MKIREATAKVVAYLRSNKTLTRMLAAFVVGVVVTLLLSGCVCLVDFDSTPPVDCKTIGQR